MSDRSHWSAEDRTEYVTQMAVYGTVRLDPEGRPAPREEPEYWKGLRVALSSGRGYGKGSYARKMAEMQEQVQRVIAKTDELHRLAASWFAAPFVAPAPQIPEIEEFRWGCYPPTDMPAPGTTAWYVRQATEFLGGKRWL